MSLIKPSHPKQTLSIKCCCDVALGNDTSQHIVTGTAVAQEQDVLIWFIHKNVSCWVCKRADLVCWSLWSFDLRPVLSIYLTIFYYSIFSTYSTF